MLTNKTCYDCWKELITRRPNIMYPLVSDESVADQSCFRQRQRAKLGQDSYYLFVLVRSRLVIYRASEYQAKSGCPTLEERERERRENGVESTSFFCLLPQHRCKLEWIRRVVSAVVMCAVDRCVAKAVYSSGLCKVPSRAVYRLRSGERMRAQTHNKFFSTRSREFESGDA